MKNQRQWIAKMLFHITFYNLKEVMPRYIVTDKLECDNRTPTVK